MKLTILTGASLFVPIVCSIKMGPLAGARGVPYENTRFPGLFTAVECCCADMWTPIPCQPAHHRPCAPLARPVIYGRPAMELASLRAKIRDIKNFPTAGILFKDITTLLKDGPAFRYVVDLLAERYQQEKIEIVVGIESRGFIFAGALAHQLRAGFVPVRKLGKLPGKTIEVEYELEYGRDALAMHEDAIQPGQRVLAVDDLLATGGTMAAALRLVDQLGGHVAGGAFLIA